MLKILVDRALMHHISFLFDDIMFDAQSIHWLCFTSQKPVFVYTKTVDSVKRAR